MTAMVDAVPVELCFVLLGLGAVFAGAYGIRRYGTPLNPLTVLVVMQIGLMTLLSGVLAYNWLPVAPYTAGDMVFTIVMAGVYLFGVLIVYGTRIGRLTKTYAWAMRRLTLASERIASRFDVLKFALLLIGAMVAFEVLAVLGGGGLLWITDPRMAYILHRQGAGPFYALTQWLLVTAMLYYLWARRPARLELAALTGFFGSMMYFTGSKNNILTVVVIAIVYYNFRVRHVPLAVCVVLGPLFFAAVLGLLVFQGSFDTVTDAILYVSEYFDTTALFLARFDEFGFLYGFGFLSDVWFYVPRGLYPGKPFEYGLTLIHGVLFPGMAAAGSTPGTLPWALAYLDFGAVGVFFSGVAAGLWQRVAYEYFLINTRSFFAFVFMMQLSLWPVMPFAPLAVFVIWSVGQSIFFRLRLLGRRTTGEYVALGHPAGG